MNKHEIITEVQALMSMDKGTFEQEFRTAHPEIPETLSLEDDALEIMEILMDNLQGAIDE